MPQLIPDVQAFLQGYPGQGDHKDARANIDFHLDKQAMRPDRRTYEQFMRDSEGDYDELEMNQ